jgi:hypothetical protein
VNRRLSISASDVLPTIDAVVERTAAAREIVGRRA